MSETITKNEPRLFVTGGRDYSVDVLRCISCMIVVLVHATRMTLPYYHNGVVEAGSDTWNVLAFYMAMFSSPTVLFVMVSGIFFLTPARNVTPQKIWKKNVLKMAAAYIFWSLIYALYRVYRMSLSGTVITSKLIIQQWIVQPPHMWYIPMIITLYILVPFFRCITKMDDKSVYKYGLILFIGAIIINTIVKTPHLPYVESIRLIASYTPVESVCQYSFWMVMGYLLYTYRPSPEKRKIIYIVGLIAIIVATFTSIIHYNITGYSDCNWINGKFTITTFLKNTALFILVTNGLSGREFPSVVKAVIKKISASTLIIYLVHYLILLIIFDYQWLFDSGINPAVRILMYAVVTYGIGAIMSIIFQLVPWKKIIPWA